MEKIVASNRLVIGHPYFFFLTLLASIRSMKTKTLLLVPVILLPFIFSCKEKEVRFSPVHFYLMDSPSNFDSINIHIKKIEANVIADSAVWVPLKTNDTIVNVFHLQDSISMQVAHDNVPQGLLKQIRFILGNDNTVVINGTSYPLQLPGAASAAFLIDIDKKLNDVFNGFILDFDASQSIVGDSGNYRLEPVIKLVR
jgi:hypothetical protein